MHIVVREKDGKKINIRLPSGLVFNGLTAKIAEVAIKKNGGEDAPQITAAQFRRLFREIKTGRRILHERGMTLVEVSEKDGDYVLVDL